MSGAADSPRVPRRGLRPALAVGFSAVSLLYPIALLSVGSELADALAVALGVSGVAFLLGWWRIGLTGYKWGPWLVFLPALALACYSIVTGFYNGMTDEPYAMPAFLGPMLHGHDPYADPVTVVYNQYGSILTIQPKYVYLPVLIVLQPFVVSYKWYAVACWAATVVLLRTRPLAMAAFAQGYVGLIAASGFNDLPVLLLVTLGFVGFEGRRQKWAEWLALGCKQFANAFALAYYLVRRDFVQVAVTVLVSVAFVVPFLVWNANAFVCGAALAQVSACGGASATEPLAHLNYWVWFLWGLAVYLDPMREALRKRWGGGRAAPPRDPPGHALGETSSSGTASPSVRGGP